jgi:hypothetical protein
MNQYYTHPQTGQGHIQKGELQKNQIPRSKLWCLQAEL